MKELSDKQIASAISYNKRSRYGEKSPRWLINFWIAHTPAGKEYAKEHYIECTNDLDILNNPESMVTVIAGEGGIQDFLYSDPGDVALGVLSSPATRVERDGKVGPGTYRRLTTYLESLELLSEDSKLEAVQGDDYIIVKKEKIKVEGVRVVTFDEPGGLSISRTSRKGYRHWGDERNAANHIAMLHWDVCFSAKSCFKVLVARGYASCFGVDNPSREDGVVTVYQWLDPGLYRAFHGGNWPNKRCLSSVDFSNAVYPKYAARYEKIVGAPRPLIRGSRNRGVSSLLGLYKAQIVAWMRIERALGRLWGMKPWFATGRYAKPDFYPSCEMAPAQAWREGDGVTIRTHLEYTAKKWDVAGYQEQLIALYFMDSEFREEFGWLKDNFKLEESYWADWLGKIKNEWEWAEIGI